MSDVPRVSDPVDDDEWSGESPSDGRDKDSKKHELLSAARALLGTEADKLGALDTNQLLAMIVDLAQKKQMSEMTLDTIKTLNRGAGVKDGGTSYLQAVQNAFSDAQSNASVPTIKALLEGKYTLNGDRYPHDLCTYQEHTDPLAPKFLGKFLDTLLGDMPYKNYRSGSQLTMTAFTVSASTLEAIGAAKGENNAINALTRYRHAITGCEEDPNELQDLNEELGEDDYAMEIS